MSSEKNETIADILRDMRRGTAIQGLWPSRDLNEILKFHANRIEEAKKLERDATPGNAAAMREALEKVLAAYKSGAIHTCAECYRDEWDDELSYLKSDVEAALSEPPRNCDRFATLDEARDDFFRNYFVEDETRSSATAFADWLFAKEEGGSRADA